MKRLLLFILILALTKFASGQTELERAESLMIDENFPAAITLFQQLVSEDPTNPDLQFNLGFCLMNTPTGRFSCIEHFEHAIAGYEKYPEKAENQFSAYFYLGEAYHINYQFDAAIETYNKILKKTDDHKIEKTVERNIVSSQLALNYFSNPYDMYVTKLGVINSEYTDHSPVITADESVIIFTSRRPGGTGTQLTESGQLFEDVYIYDRRKGIEAKPENIGSLINTDWHEATCGLSVDGQEMYLYRSTGITDGDIYYSKLNGITWSEPEKLNENINSKGRETHATVSADGQYFYFTSNRSGGEGGYDIYVSKRKNDGQWGKVKNLGKTINTEFDEEGPYIHPDGKTLYFSSKGHPGIGGYDVFWSVADDKGKWSEPVNMGFPLNTVNNDVFYVPTADGKRGYYASEQSGSPDIYIANLFNQKEKILTLVSGIFQDSYQFNHTYPIEDCKLYGDTTVLPNKRVIYKEITFNKGDSVIQTHRTVTEREITIADSIYKVPVDATIFVLDTETKRLENTYAPNSVTGDYLFVLSERKNYKIYYEAEDYIFDTKDIALKGDSSYRKIYYVAETDSIVHGKVHKAKKFGFDMGQTTLNDYTSLELDLLAIFLKKHDDLMVNISGYDYLFDDSNRNFFRLEYEFAEARKEKVKTYLTDKGVNPRNIYTDMFPADIIGDTLEYTIFDNIVLAQAEQEKVERRAYFKEVQVAANLTEEEIYKLYGDSLIASSDTALLALKTVFVKDILFDYNKYQTAEYEANLTLLADYLKENPDAKIELHGHTDETGTSDYNKNLAVKRANFVRNQLTSKGVKQTQIAIKAFGHTAPISKNKGADGKFDKTSMAYNRRIEINIVKQGKNSALEVIRIKVPEKYQLESETVTEIRPPSNTNNGSLPKVYSICIVVSEKKLNLDDFSSYPDVHEKQYPDNKFMYFFGNYTKEDELLDTFQKVKASNTGAFIFLRK